jgi:hypothetical protein
MDREAELIHGAESTFASTHEVGYRLAPMHPTSMRPSQKRQTEHAYYSIVGTKRLERVAALIEALATTDTPHSHGSYSIKRQQLQVLT